MKRLLFAAMAALALAGCQKSVDQQFEEMYAYQKANDPEAAAATADAYKYRARMPEAQKKMMVDAYAEVRKAREAVERDRPQ